MDFKRLRTLVAVAELGTVSRAAEQLRIAQPALSRQIMDLEAELGLKLFDRVGRGLVPTREGEQIIESSRSVLNQVASLTERASGLRNGTGGLLKVAASPQIIESVFPALLRQFESAYPHVQVMVSEAVGRDQLTMIERGAVDAAVGLLQALQAEDRFAFHELPAVEILAAFSPQLPLRDRRKVEISELAHYPLLLLDASYVFRRSFDAACRLAGIEPNVLMQSRAPHTLLAFAESGRGVAVIQTAISVARYKLQTVPVTYGNKRIGLPMAVIWDKKRTLPRYAQPFFKLLAGHMRQSLPAGGRALGRRAK